MRPFIEGSLRTLSASGPNADLPFRLDALLADLRQVLGQEIPCVLWVVLTLVVMLGNVLHLRTLSSMFTHLSDAHHHHSQHWETHSRDIPTALTITRWAPNSCPIPAGAEPLTSHHESV
jgi:hypothetical protein